MEKKRSSGCRLVAWIVAGLIVVFFVVVLGIFWMFTGRFETPGEARVQAAEPQDRELVLDAAEWDDLKPLEQGAPVSLRHFLLMMEDPRATELARETFRGRAEGAEVAWRMMLRDVRSEDGVLGAVFEVPYVFRSANLTRSSSLPVRAEFGEDQRDGLIRLRQGDWVTVGGRLDPRGEPLWIRGAWVVTPE